MHKAIVAIVGCLALAVTSVAAASDPVVAPAPIEGTWSFEGGRVLVTAAGSGSFEGRVVNASKFAACQHPVGQLIWKLNGTDAAYSGTHVWYHKDCSEAPGGNTTWTIQDTDAAVLKLRFCTARPQTGQPTVDESGAGTGSTECFTLTRLKPPAATTTTATSGSLLAPPTSCASRRRFRVRIVSTAGDPVVRARLRVNGVLKAVVPHRVGGRLRLISFVDLRGLPRGPRVRVSILAQTRAGKVISGSRYYRVCTAKIKRKVVHHRT
jgi:hypothetical protein